MMLDKKKIWAIFLFKFKMGCKTEDNSQQTDSAVVAQEALQRRWEPWRWEAHWLAMFDRDQLRGS